MLIRTLLLLLGSLLRTTIVSTAETTGDGQMIQEPSSSGTNGMIASKLARRVRGCPDLESLEAVSIAQFTTKELQQLSCFCGPPGLEDSGGEERNSTDNEVSISCIFESTVEDLSKTLELVRQANKTVERLLLDNFEVGRVNGSLVNALLNGNFSNLRHMEIRNCKGEVLNLAEQIVKDGHQNLFSKLESMEITQCSLEGMPTAILVNSPNLRRLILSSDKLKVVNTRDLETQGTKLEHLDLSGNLLRSDGIERGSLAQLKALKSFYVGDHNFAGTVLLGEIGKLSELEELDMTRIDGLESTAQLKFGRESKLKQLILTGCNLKFLNKTSLAGLNMLETLDVRVNVIEKIEPKCFKGLDRLKLLSLAGNFIREIPIENGTDFWMDLPNLEHLDLGWNELKRINRSTFAGISHSLERLILRHNEDLSEIDPNTFSEMSQLKLLNISGTVLKRIGPSLLKLPQLKELYLSGSNIEEIDSSAFDSFKKTITTLNLSRNKLRTLDERLFDGANSLYAIDLSENNWLCDDKLLKVVNTLHKRYEEARINSADFELRNEALTICRRPYSWQNKTIFELRDADAKSLRYDERLDTTTAIAQTTTVMGDSLVDIFNLNTTWQPFETIIGGGPNEHGDFVLNISANDAQKNNNAEAGETDAGKPRYDINKVQYGEKYGTRTDSDTWLTGVIVTLMILVTAICIIVVVRRKNTIEGAKKVGMEAREAMTAF